MEKYEKIRVVGRGAYGTVHLCRRLSDKKYVIIKQIPVEQMTKEERQAALNEVKVLSMLSHPNIIEYYENFLEDKALMIVMEYAEGGTLLDYLHQRNNRLLEEEEILRFFAQMLLSLQHVHSKQILHRDLKTQNILLDKKREVVKIGDFGISKVLSSKSKAYTVVGTPCYISPELCEGKPYNQKSDIWALGCVLYELASLKRAFEAANLPALILKIMRGTFAPISEHYSEELRSLILSMLHLDPAKRPDIKSIMAQPIVINALMNLHTDLGKIPCTKTQRPLSSAMPTTTRSRLSGRGSSASIRDVLNNKPQALSSVFFWGGGIPTAVKLPLPTSDTQVTEVSTGRTQKAAVTKNGRLFVWESPAVGTESMIPGAIENAIPAFIPRYLEGQSAVAIQHVSCGDLFTACLTDRGILMTFGSGASGCLGHGNFNDVIQAKIVEALLGYEVVQVSCGASHVLAVTNENEVFAWGRGDNGRLGLGNQESYTKPMPVPVPDDLHPCSVHCGVDCSMLLTLDNKLLCCGSNRYNKCCLDEIHADGICTKSVEEVHTFNQVTSPPIGNNLIKGVAMGTSHTAVVSVDGQCFTFGANQFGQLGYQTDFNSKQGQMVKALQLYRIVRVACGDTFTVAVSEDGEIFSWGKSARGRLGRSDEDTMTPKKVIFQGEDVFTVVSISCSHGNTLVATKPTHGTGNSLD
ncbi:hypothetical protein CHS0354_006307 [Potamilus streckersoni]|uniref:Serine/threonine-protein kinase Nek8 n=1 Tax=Potamilus streckersoni TaxID=2493646 RepID=A0AAE0S508_9BIVA|nr:hypothetical protein CHS0354_006307 [Potamilus streckersoni]